MRIMKFSLTAAAAAIALATLPACAQPAPQAPAATSDADPALWVVKDEDTTIYLFGTVHVLKPGLSWFDEAVKTAFDGSQELVIEMVEPDAATLQGIVMAKAMAPADAPALSSRIPADKRELFTRTVAESGVPAAAFDRFDPWFAAITLTYGPMQKAGYDPSSGAEKVLTAAAKAAGKPVKGLETAEEQIGFFDSLSADAQLTYLVSTVEELPKFGAMMDTMVADWAKGDATALGNLLNENLKDSPEVAKALLYDRNGRWATWIAERMKAPGTVFVAVGAGHLAGEQSVQDKLGALKLKATRVDY